MTMHVVGLFDDATDAQAVIHDLEAAGFDSGTIELHRGNASGIVSRLTGAGVPEHDAQVYAEGVRRGGSVVTVHTQTDDQAYQAADIMNRHNVIDIERRGQEYCAAGWSRFDEDAAPTTTTSADYDTTHTADRDTLAAETSGVQADSTVRDTTQRTEEIVIPVAQEELRVGKREVDRGGVRVDVDVEDVPVQEQVSVRDETVRVERRPVDRPLSDADAALQEGTFEVREQDEEVIADKQARVVEEVVVRKDVEERTETVQDTVRRTDVDIQELPAQSTTSGYREGGDTTTSGAQEVDRTAMHDTTARREGGLMDRIEDTTGIDIDRDHDVGGRDPRD